MTIRTERVLVARVVFPVVDVADVLPLYIDGPASAAEVLDRRSLRIAAGGTVSLGSYFNHFPVGYWATHTVAREVNLTVHTVGPGRVQVLRSNANGQTILAAEFSAGGITELSLPIDGEGALWLDLEATDGDLRLLRAEWCVAREAVEPYGTVTIGMATFNRPDECIAQLSALGSDLEVLRLIDEILVVDQGDVRVESRETFASVVAPLATSLRVICQENLGGSGGFSRAMWESVEADVSDYVLLLDDDAISEPEAILRAVRFADAARRRRRVIVGGGMLHLDDRARMYAQSEQWNEQIGWVDLERPEAYNHDFAARPFRSSTFWHALQRSDYNGWWFCLIPTDLLRDIGLSLPLFLKGDDAEFGRRARAAGVETVSLPGVAVWHLGWGGKAPTRSWEAYFVHRNRIIGELVHAKRSRPVGVIIHLLLGDLKCLVMLQYSAVALRARAVEDIFAGPADLAPSLRTRTAEVRALRAGYPDAVDVDPHRFPDLPVVRALPVPTGLRGAIALTRTWARHLVVPARPTSKLAPEARLNTSVLTWSTFSRLDSALVPSPDGRSSAWFVRSRRHTWRALRASVGRYWRLFREWPDLADDYRAEAPALSGASSWATRFVEGS